VVLDRYWYSTVATHRMLGVECNCSDFSQLVRPDLVVHLTAREDVRKDRMAKRGLDANDIRLLDAGGELLRHFGEVLPPDTREIDTTSLDVAQTAGRIRKFLKEGGGL
jgi:thymidylate kinase